MPQYVCFYYLAINECSIFVGAALIAVLGVDRLIALTMPLKFVYTFVYFTNFLLRYKSWPKYTHPDRIRHFLGFVNRELQR